MRNVAVSPDTVQTLDVAEVNVTARPELAVALRVSGVPTTCAPGLLKVMVCGVNGAMPTPLTVTVPVLFSWSVAVTVTPSLPPALGVKLTVVPNAAPPLTVEEQLPLVLTVAVPVPLVPANVTAGAGVEEQLPSFRTVRTGLRVDDGLTAVPTAELGTLTLPIVSCPTVSPPEPRALEYTSKYRLRLLSMARIFALWVETV